MSTIPSCPLAFVIHIVYSNHMSYKYRNYTDQQIIDNAKLVKSMASLIRSLGIKSIGGNYKNIGRKVVALNVDTSHWTGQGWNKDNFKTGIADYKGKVHRKAALIRLRGFKCECCSITEWQNKPITLEIHHIDGESFNNHPDNLQLLCPNCHAQTPNWRNRKRGRS